MSQPLRIGLIGAGGIAKAHRDGYLAAGAQVVALADPQAVTLTRRAAEWSVDRSYTDYREMLAAGGLDAVSVCAPTVVHHPATLAAAEAGLHVLCEKPIALDLGQAAEMITACEQAGVVLMINHQMRSHGAAVWAKEKLASGVLGEISHLRLRQAHDWSGSRTVGPSFSTYAVAGGGTLLDNGCHLMDFARYVGGDVQEVYARLAHRKFDIEVEDTAHVSMRFASGAIGTVEVAWTATGWEEGWWIYGSEGALEYSNRSGTPLLRHSFRSSAGTAWDQPDLAELRFGGLPPHSRHVLAFVEAVRGEREVVCTGQDGLEAVRLVLSSYRSAELGQAVPVH